MCPCPVPVLLKWSGAMSSKTASNTSATSFSPSGPRPDRMARQALLMLAQSAAVPVLCLVGLFVLWEAVVVIFELPVFLLPVIQNPERMSPLSHSCRCASSDALFSRCSYVEASCRICEGMCLSRDKRSERSVSSIHLGHMLGGGYQPVSVLSSGCTQASQPSVPHLVW